VYYWSNCLLLHQLTRLVIFWFLSYALVDTLILSKPKLRLYISLEFDFYLRILSIWDMKDRIVSIYEFEEFLWRTISFINELALIKMNSSIKFQLPIFYLPAYQVTGTCVVDLEPRYVTWHKSLWKILIIQLVTSIQASCEVFQLHRIKIYERWIMPDLFQELERFLFNE